MSTDEYVPSDARMREQYIWAHAREAEGVAEQSYGIQVCSEVWDAWLAAHDARVRRDAAREALDGFKAWRGTRQCPAISPPDPCHRPEGHTEPHAYDIPEGECDWREVDWSDTDTYRDTHYPETGDTMTTDDFTKAARTEAERVARENTPLEYGSIWDAFVDAYAAGLRARTHLAAQEPTDAEVEAAARAMFDVVSGGLDWDGEHNDEATRERFRNMARAALAAARAARRDEGTRGAAGG